MSLWELRKVRSDEERNEVLPILRELRPDLTAESFSEVVESAGKADGYTLLGAYREGRCVGLMGYRFLTDFVHGYHLYVDDLVVTEGERSHGLGAHFLREAERIGREKNVRGLRLCTGVENERGRRFYEREGWSARALAFKKFPF